MGDLVCYRCCSILPTSFHRGFGIRSSNFFLNYLILLDIFFIETFSDKRAKKMEGHKRQLRKKLEGPKRDQRKTEAALHLSQKDDFSSAISHAEGVKNSIGFYSLISYCFIGII